MANGLPPDGHICRERNSRNAKHHPPLHSTHVGVQIRLTIGQTPRASSPYAEKKAKDNGGRETQDSLAWREGSRNIDRRVIQEHGGESGNETEGCIAAGFEK